MPSIEHLDVTSLLEEGRMAFYGALFAVAAVDGRMASEELELIYKTIGYGRPEGRSRRIAEESR